MQGINQRTKKAVAIITRANKIYLRAVPGATFFVSEPLYNKRNSKFLSNLQFAGKVNARSTLNVVTRQENVYEFNLKNIAVSTGKDDFILPKLRYRNKGVEFDHHLFFLEDKNVADEIKKYIEPPLENRDTYDWQERSLKKDM